MWISNIYKNGHFCYLWNRLPKKVSDNDLINERFREFGWNEYLYKSVHDYIPIPYSFQYMFKDINDPVEVELVRDDSDTPMFYGQKYLDSKGNENVYISQALTYSYYPIIETGLFTKRKKKSSILHVSYGKKPTGEYEDLKIYVKPRITRIRPKDFKWSVEDGWIPLTIKIKE